MRKTKIICTLGPAVDDKEVLKRIALEGMDVARFNFSHGGHEEQQKRFDMLCEVRLEANLPIAALLDTKGPEIRTGEIKNNEVMLVDGSSFIIVNEDVEGDNTKCSISYKDLYNDVAKGGRILIDDGLVELVVDDIKEKDIYCHVQNGGKIGTRKGVNVPGAKINLPSMTKKDVEDILFAIKNDFDFIAASFVRKAQDIIEIQKLLEKHGADDIKIIAKIESREGIDNFDEILKVSDGIMVARGDLGVEIPVDEVPIVQKNLIEKCIQSSKPVITATQMLDSMIRNPRPTRAEASDVANAIFDGTSAIMLSGETAIGKYPLESLMTMVRITKTSEKSINYWKLLNKSAFNLGPSITNGICHAACTTAYDLNAAAIVAVTSSGRTARMISRFRPQCTILSTTDNPKVQRQLSLSWGVVPYLVNKATTIDEMFENSIAKSLESKIAENGDIIVITAGAPVGVSGTTNLLKVEVVGKVLIKAEGFGSGNVSGEILVAKNYEEANQRTLEGQILVVPFTNNEMMPAIKRSAAVIVEEGRTNFHASTIAMALDIPVLIGADHATQILKSGNFVHVDAERGLVYNGD